MDNEEVIRVYLVDDHAMVREGLASLLKKDPRIQIVGQGGDGAKAREEILQADPGPDVVILDISMPGMNGLDLCRSLMRKNKKLSILMLTMYDDEQLVARALEYGASGYLLKEAVVDQLVEAVKIVFRGGLYLGSGISRGVLQRVGSEEADPYEQLTTRERQVLQMIVEGKNNRQIAENLDVAVKTIDTHRAHLMHKLNIHDRTELVKFALRKGIVTLD